MRFFVMFVTAVCVLFLIKLRWPKKKNFYKISGVFCPAPARGLRLAIISCFTKGVTSVCGTVGARESTTYRWPRVPGTSLSFTCLKSECPAQARMGVGAGFKWLVHKLSSFQSLISRKQLREIELQMVSAISFGWFADFGKALTIIQRSSQSVYSDKW